MGMILIVDDQPLILELFAEVVHQMGHHAHLAKNGSEGLELIRKNDFDIIISDYHMPEMNGVDFLKEVRKIDKNVPFIFLTGQKLIDIDGIDELGIYGTLSKPFRIHDLEAKIAEILQSNG
jgi:CheY-like chemotaxis protein